KDAEEILQFVANRPRKISVSKPPAPKPSSSQQVQSPIPGTDSDDDPSPQSPPSTAEIEDEYFRDVEPELWDVMRRHADDLEANLRMQMDENLPFAHLRDLWQALPAPSHFWCLLLPWLRLQPAGFITRKSPLSLESFALSNDFKRKLHFRKR